MEMKWNDICFDIYRFHKVSCHFVIYQNWIFRKKIQSKWQLKKSFKNTSIIMFFLANIPPLAQNRIRIIQWSSTVVYPERPGEKKKMSTIRPFRCLYKHSAFALRHSSRLASALVQWEHTAGGNSNSGGENRTRAARTALGAGSLALALLAADHVFNGAYT